MRADAHHVRLVGKDVLVQLVVLGRQLILASLGPGRPRNYKTASSVTDPQVKTSSSLTGSVDAAQLILQPQGTQAAPAGHQKDAAGLVADGAPVGRPLGPLEGADHGLLVDQHLRGLALEVVDQVGDLLHAPGVVLGRHVEGQEQLEVGGRGGLVRQAQLRRCPRVAGADVEREAVDPRVLGVTDVLFPLRE